MTPSAQRLQLERKPELARLVSSVFSVISCSRLSPPLQVVSPSPPRLHVSSDRRHMRMLGECRSRGRLGKYGSVPGTFPQRRYRRVTHDCLMRCNTQTRSAPRTWYFPTL